MSVQLFEGVQKRSIKSELRVRLKSRERERERERKKGMYKILHTSGHFIIQCLESNIYCNVTSVLHIILRRDSNFYNAFIILEKLLYN